MVVSVPKHSGKNIQIVSSSVSKWVFACMCVHYLEVGWLGGVVSVFMRNWKMAVKVDEPSESPPAMHESSSCSASCSAGYVACVFNNVRCYCGCGVCGLSFTHDEENIRF